MSELEKAKFQHAANDNFDPLVDVILQQKSGSVASIETSSQAFLNISGFFSILDDWQRAANDNTPQQPELIPETPQNES